MLYVYSYIYSVLYLKKNYFDLIRVDAIDPALRRPGRFDSEIEITVPTAEERLQILEV